MCWNGGETNMSKCKKCNSELKDGVVFCGVCGASVNKDSVEKGFYW